jgi:alpha-L-fucosidase 2
MIPGSREATAKEFGENTPAGRCAPRSTSSAAAAGNGTSRPPPGSPSISGNTTPSPATRSFLAKPPGPSSRSLRILARSPRRKLPDGKLVVPKRWSPEHGPREDGVAHDQQIVWDLFTNTLETAKSSANPIPAFQNHRRPRKAVRPEDRIMGPNHGMDHREARAGKGNHRHTSHLFAVHPGRQITLAWHTGTGKPPASRSNPAAPPATPAARGPGHGAPPCGPASASRKRADMIRGLLTHNTSQPLHHPPAIPDRRQPRHHRRHL